jgi:uncharacterized protein YkwD
MTNSPRLQLACALLLLNACGADGSDDGSGAGGAGGMVLPPAAIAGAGSAATGAGTGGAAGPTAPPIAPPDTSTAGTTAPPITMAGGGGSTGAAGSGGATAPPDPSSCPPAPDGSSAGAIAALDIVNSARLAAGGGCVNMVTEINLAAQNHCDYYAMNSGDCTSMPHYEVDSCAGFTGMGPGDRMKAAGYAARFGGGEVMAFYGDPAQAIGAWINSVWHRIPILDPWTSELGYGGSEQCDTIDFGASGDAPQDTVVVYPYPDQVDVPTSFDGNRETPMPPAPPGGWPSSSPITLYARDLTVTEHVLTLDGDPTPIEHMWLTGDDPDYAQFLRSSVFIFGNVPFAANTKYRVRIVGTFVGGALEREWTFTTGAAERMWGGR